MQNKYTSMLAEKQIKAQSDLIMMSMPDNAVLQKITAIQHGHSGPTVYSYENVPFLEIWPPSFETVLEDGSYKIKATQNYRVIKQESVNE